MLTVDTRKSQESCANEKMLKRAAAKSQQKQPKCKNADCRYEKKSAKLNTNDPADSKILKNDL